VSRSEGAKQIAKLRYEEEIPIKRLQQQYQLRDIKKLKKSFIEARLCFLDSLYVLFRLDFTVLLTFMEISH